MTDRITRPKHAIVVTSYAELEQFVSAFSAGHLNLLILIGRAGISKSQTIRQAVGEGTCWIESNATAFGIYQKLYQHRDQLVVIDDVDTLYSDRAAVRLLKCVAQTDAVKNIAWHSAAVGTSAVEIPREFKTRSRVCIIANDWKVLDANVAAVQDRGHLVLFEPSAEEIHKRVAEWFWDQHVFDWMAEHLHLIPELSMRHYIRAAELKASGIDWVKILLSESVPEKALLVAKLRADPQYHEERERVKAFRERGGGSLCEAPDGECGRRTAGSHVSRFQVLHGRPVRAARRLPRSAPWRVSVSDGCFRGR
jgi:hypothetical protein